MGITGREKELALLNKFYQSPKAELMAVYGRRRVGKTFLIEQFYKNKSKPHFHATGIKDATMKEQIRSFTKVIGNTFYNGADLTPKKNWLDVFEQLTEAITKTSDNTKIILFFDELPWMATKRSRFLQALDHYWNRYWSSNPNIKLITCGSAASWILENLINNKGGLYNRITYQIELRPFSLAETKFFLHNKEITLNNDHILKLYLAMGGIPHYLDHIQPGLSADQNIDSLCFSYRGLLYGEFKKLFASLFNQHELCEELIRIIAKHHYGISQTELMKQSSKSAGGRLKKRLQDLEDAGFIDSFVPYQHKERGIYYRIIDEYTLFYLKWIEPVLTSIKRRDKESGYWLAKQKSASWQSWAGYAFEAVCYKHISQIRKKLNINVGAEIGTWRLTAKKDNDFSGAQIDLLFDRDDDTVTICEIKLTHNLFTIDKKVALNIENKIRAFQQSTKTNKQIFVALISAKGVKPNQHSKQLVSQTVLLDDLFFNV